MEEQRVGSALDLGPGSVAGVGSWVVLNVDGERFALSRRCRHLRADLADGSIDAEGCLECPWHHARYDPHNGRMTLGPQGAFAKVPGLDASFIALTKLLPLRRAEVIEREGDVFVQS
ncbi:MAG TPA: Rieske 2Fe-2S domain-containing protein [Solirubrobacterales bacterium]|jgi:nitrite reductase/ring-hydroxylating ferredoxin subunit